MLKTKLFLVYLFLRSFFSACPGEKDNAHFNCAKKSYKAERFGKLPKKINESSGLELAEGKDDFWTINDGGGSPSLYKIDINGCLLDSVRIPNTSNIDWEDLAKDSLGNIYIGDFGNNLNARKNLRIYKVNKDFSRVDTIKFAYPDQKDFPPEYENRNFDVEAFFWYSSKLYLISKNRGKGPVKLYGLPDLSGEYKALLIQELPINGMVTAADINDNGTEVAILTYGKVYFFDIENVNGKLHLNSKSCRKFNRSGQSEAIVYLKNDDVLITNENRKVFLFHQRMKK